METINNNLDIDCASSSSTIQSGGTRTSCTNDRRERSHRKSRLHDRGVILRTYMTFTNTDTRSSLNRTLLLDNALYEEPIGPYVPPIFLLIMYERSPYTRYITISDDTAMLRTPADDVEDVKLPDVRNTEVVFGENKQLVRDMLRTIDCLPESMEHTFLRLEHAGSLQSMFSETFPTPAIRIGCLARLKYKSLRKRTKALDFLCDNGPSNSDMYVINYSSNNCMTTVTRYLEPLFKHAQELQKDRSVDSADGPDQPGDNGIFDINFHMFDREPEMDNDGPAIFVGRSDRSVSRRMRTPIGERTGRASPLTTHDVERFYRNCTFYGDRNGAVQLQSLPVVYVRQERDFICMSSSTEYDKRPVVFHVYYVWNGEIADKLSKLLSSNKTTDDDLCLVRTCVSDVFDSRISAYAKMLDDAKLCFWKKNVNTYIRLVIDPLHEDTSYSRFVLNALLAPGITSGKVSLQSRIEGCRSKNADGRIEMFPNAITLDCSKIVADLDDGVSAFAASYKWNARDAVTFANADGVAGLADHVLASRQRRIGNMLLHFKSERIAELAHTMASEMYLGVLDLYGVAETDYNMRYDTVSNYQFLHTLVNESLYTSSTTIHTDLHTVLKKNNAEDERLVPPPCASFQEGVHFARYEKEILEFDIESAYPSIIDTFNISPETAVIMNRADFNRQEKQLEKTLVSTNDGTGFELSRWCFVVPHALAPNEFVIVSLVPALYKGYAAKLFSSLVLKRRAKKNIAAYFYKRLANRVVGCMGKIGSDLYAVHCLVAVTSLCRTVMTKTIDGLKHSVRVLRTQTDGCVVQASRRVEKLSDEIQRVFDHALAGLLATRAAGAGVSQSLLRIRVRDVNACFIAGQNKYAIAYANDEKILKGHPAKCVPSARAEKIVTDAIFDTLESISSPGYDCCSQDIIGSLMDNVLERMTSETNNDADDADDFYYVERIFPLADRREEEKILDGKYLKHGQHCRFGDVVPLWPVMRIEGDRAARGYVHRPQRLQGPVVADRFSVLKTLINCWACELCRIQCHDFKTDRSDQDNYASLFYTGLARAGYTYARSVYSSQSDPGQ